MVSKANPRDFLKLNREIEDANPRGRFETDPAIEDVKRKCHAHTNRGTKSAKC